MVRKAKTNKIIVNIVLLLVSLSILIPLWMMFVNSFKTPGEALTLGLGLPETWMFENYYNVFIEGRLFRGLMNSCLITFSSVFLTLFIGSLASFIIARRKTKFTIVIKTIISQEWLLLRRWLLQLKFYNFKFARNISGSHFILFGVVFAFCRISNVRIRRNTPD